MDNKVVGLIPVREGSQRVKNKNFRPFNNKQSLLDIKIEQLKNSGCFDEIYISSDSENVRDISKNSGVNYLKRKPEMCVADIPWAEVVKHIMETIPGNPIVVWALVTSPLFKDFISPVNKFLSLDKSYDSLVAVLPKKSFFLNKNGRGINFNPGFWHPYSQELETYYEVTGSCYIARKNDMLKWGYWFGPNPFLHEVSYIESIDVDTPEDFEFAQSLYQIRVFNS